jgi:hypothetical protein
MEKSDLLNMYLKKNIMLVGEQLRFDMLIPIAHGGNKKNCACVVNTLLVGSSLFDFLPCWPPSLVRGWNDTVT